MLRGGFRIRAIARVMALPLALILSFVSVDAALLVPGKPLPETYCCCAETGVDARCTCTGSCCRHEGVSEHEQPEATPLGVTCLARNCSRSIPREAGSTAHEPATPARTFACMRRTESEALALACFARMAAHSLPPMERPPNTRAR